MGICQIKSVCYHLSGKCTFDNIFIFFLFFHFFSFASHSSAVSQIKLGELMRVDTVYDSIGKHRT